MVLNFTLVPRTDAEPGESFSRNRPWYGFDPTATPQQLWEVNRGDWSLADHVLDHRYATLSYQGAIIVVASISGRTQVSPGFWALEGEVLSPDHPAARALLGERIPKQRNPVQYLRHLADVEDIPVAAPDLPQETGRPAVIATWSPDTGGFDGLLTFEETIAATGAGDLVHDRWSVGQRKHGIVVGDRVYLLRLGQEAGIVASGWATTPPFTSEHWDPDRADAGDMTQYIHLDWDYVVAVEDRLPREALRSILPGTLNNWGPLGGGQSLTPEQASVLAGAWASHLGERQAGATVRGGTGRAGGRGGGQGIQMDPERRKTIEDAAQHRLEEHFRAEGFLVEDVRFKEHYDAIATRGDEVVYLEAKGTTTAGESVIVTGHEVRWAEDHPGEVVMGLWRDMEFKGDDEIDPAAGTFSVFPFDPAAGRLVARQYDWYMDR